MSVVLKITWDLANQQISLVETLLLNKKTNFLQEWYSLLICYGCLCVKIMNYRTLLCVTMFIECFQEKGKLEHPTKRNIQQNMKGKWKATFRGEALNCESLNKTG